MLAQEGAEKVGLFRCEAAQSSLAIRTVTPARDDFKSKYTRHWSKSRMAPVLNALVPAVTKVGPSLGPHYAGEKRDLYKGSPICHFFILLQAGAEADTHKDPFQQGIIYHATEIHKRQIILRSSCFHWPAQGLKPAAIRCHGHGSAGSLNRRQRALILQKQSQGGFYGYLSLDSVGLILIRGRLVISFC